MPRTPKHTPTKSQRDQNHQSEDAILERMDEALKRMMTTPPETHKEMVARRRGDAPAKRKAKSAKRG